MTAMEMKSSDARKSFDIWKGISWGILALYALFLIYPLIRLLISAVYVDGHFTLEYFGQFFAKKYYTSTIWNSLKVSFMVTLVSLVIGVPLAYFYTMYDLKGKRVLQVLIILCSMSAPFIGAYSWILLLGRSGLMVQVDRDHAADDLRLPGDLPRAGTAAVPVCIPVCVRRSEERRPVAAGGVGKPRLHECEAVLHRGDSIMHADHSCECIACLHACICGFRYAAIDR